MPVQIAIPNPLLLHSDEIKIQTKTIKYETVTNPGYYWADDVVIMGPGAPTIKGKKEFLKMFSNMQNIPGFNMTWNKQPTVIEISMDGQMVYLFAKNKVTMTDSAGTVRSGFDQAVQVWKKDKERNWKAEVSVMYPDETMK